MLKTTKSLERSISKKLRNGNNEVIRFGIRGSNGLLNRKIV